MKEYWWTHTLGQSQMYHMLVDNFLCCINMYYKPDVRYKIFNPNHEQWKEDSKFIQFQMIYLWNLNIATDHYQDGSSEM